MSRFHANKENRILGKNLPLAYLQLTNLYKYETKSN